MKKCYGDCIYRVQRSKQFFYCCIKEKAFPTTKYSLRACKWYTPKGGAFDEKQYKQFSAEYRAECEGSS